jgi:hypothetical protein
MISRDRESGLVLAVKGGHNQELHNQNDVGSLIVHIDGESLITDPGRGKYTRQYFGPERYDYLVNSSRGHSVPVVNGFLQPVGRESAAKVLEHSHGADRDVLALDMTAAYPAKAGLVSLRRDVVLDRERHEVRLTDDFAFSGTPAKFESVLITFHDVEQEPGRVDIRGERNAVRIRYDPDRVSFSLDVVPGVDLDSEIVDVRRLVFSPIEPVGSGAIGLTIGKLS